MNKYYSQKFEQKVRQQLAKCEQTSSQIAEAIGASPDTVRRCLKELCNAGMAQAFNLPGTGGKFSAQAYRHVGGEIVETPSNLSETILDILEDGAASVYEIRAEIGASGQDVLSTLRSLMADGLVERRGEYSGRERDVHVTRYVLARTKPILGSLRKAA